MDRGVRIEQAAMIVAEQIATFFRGEIACEIAPHLGEDAAHPGHKPRDLLAPAQEYAAQDEADAAFAPGFGIGERQTRPPGAAEHQPALDNQVQLGRASRRESVCPYVSV